MRARGSTCDTIAASGAEAVNAVWPGRAPAVRDDPVPEGVRPRAA